MEPEFWHERWRTNEIGFHRASVNPGLKRYLPHLNVHPGDSVFVPLCGKSIDMRYLREHGALIVGVELSEIALRAFFDESGIVAEVSRKGAFSVFSGGGFRIFCGDFFALEAAQIEGVSAVYDRAALIALPAPLRSAYARHMTALLSLDTRTLLITHEYPAHEMQGPPFSITDEEVGTLFGPSFGIELLERRDMFAEEPRFRERGVTAFFENTYLLTRR
ncbi:MAG: thiopurine S-methyltransferase [Acidiferrobacteraceae bacterium]